MKTLRASTVNFGMNASKLKKLICSEMQENNTLAASLCIDFVVIDFSFSFFFCYRVLAVVDSDDR